MLGNRLMSKEIDILEKLKKSKINLIGDLVRDVSENNKFYAFIDIIRSKEGVQKPSNYELRLLSENFEGIEAQVSFILIENKNEDIQGSIKATLFRFFPNIVRNVFISPKGKKMTIWVEVKKVLTREETNAITSKVQKILQAHQNYLNNYINSFY